MRLGQFAVFFYGLLSMAATFYVVGCLFLAFLGGMQSESNPAKAVSTFTMLQSIAPGFSDLSFQIGECELKQKHPEKTTEIANKLLKADPKSGPGHALLAEVAVQAEKYAEAVEQFKLTDDEHRHQHGLTYVKCLVALERHADALTVIEELIKAGKESTELFELQASIYTAQGKKEDADKANQKAKDLAPKP